MGFLNFVPSKKEQILPRLLVTYLSPHCLHEKRSDLYHGGKTADTLEIAWINGYPVTAKIILLIFRALFDAILTL